MEFRDTPDGQAVEVLNGGTAFGPLGVARICGVAPRTVTKWMDSGRLKSYHVPGQCRHIPRIQLLRFLDEHGMTDAARNVP